MANVWDADFEITPELVRSLVTAQFPELGEEPIHRLSHGWDNEAYLVGGRMVFRFPRRTIAVKLIEREIEFLPRLAPHLPVPIPVSTLVGAATDSYPSRWAGYPLLPGVTGCRARPTADIGPRIADFLRRLHSIPIDAQTRAVAPGDEIRRADMAERLPKLVARLELVGENSLIPKVREAAIASPWPGEPVWVHGDFYPSHLLVDEGELSGVIDWGDVHLGDPALDLAIAFMLLEPELHDEFFAAYGGIDESTYARALFRAVHYGAMFKEYGAAEGIERFMQMGERTLQTIARL